MRRWFFPLLSSLLLLSAFFGVSVVYAVENARVEDTVFLPQEFYVGDRVELRISFIPDEGMMVRPPAELPVLSWMDLHELTVMRQDTVWEARILFTSYAPGTRSLPPIEMGDVRFDALKIHTRAILAEEEHEFYGLKNQLLIPGTRFAIIFLVFLLFFGPIIVLNSAGRIHHGFKSLIVAQRGRRPYRRIQRSLKELAERQAQMSSRRFYIVLDEEFRRYLSDRTCDDFLSITSSEFKASLLAALSEGGKDRVPAVEELLRRSDLIKFGGENSDKNRREGDIELVLSVVRLVEEIERARRKTEQQRRRKGRSKRRFTGDHLR
jgi:hypothetical protein